MENIFQKHDPIKSLKNSPKKNFETDVGDDNKPILNPIRKFKNHPSITVIKSRKKEEQTINFNYVSNEEVLNEIRKIQTAETIQQNGIPTKILKQNSEVFVRHFHENIWFCTENSTFLSENPVLKVSDVTSTFKKTIKDSERLLRHISTLPNISKTYERIK